MATADRRRAASSLGLPVVLALAAICAVILVSAPTAIAAASAVCDQYPGLPQCQAAGGTGGAGPTADGGGPSVGGGGEDGEGAGAVAGVAGGGGGAAGVAGITAGGDSGAIPGSDYGATGNASKAAELPFTGYPLTPLVLLLLTLLGGGIAARAYVAARDRLAIRPPRHSF